MADNDTQIAVRSMMDDFLAILADTPGSTIADIGRLIETHLLPAHEVMVREQVAKEARGEADRCGFELQDIAATLTWFADRITTLPPANTRV